MGKNLGWCKTKTCLQLTVELQKEDREIRAAPYPCSSEWKLKDSSISGGFPTWKAIPKKPLICLPYIFFSIPSLSFGVYTPQTFVHTHTKWPSLAQHWGDS